MKTGIQIDTDFSTGKVVSHRPNFSKCREMRQHPTLGLGADLSVALILSSSWSYEGEDERQVEFVKSVMEPVRTNLLRVALNGENIFGWKAFEVVEHRRDGAGPLSRSDLG